MKGLKYFLIGLVLVFYGCANKQIGDMYYKNKQYEKAFKIYNQFAKKGFPEQSYKITKMICSGKLNKDSYIEKKYALTAYNNGYKKAGLCVADAYVKEKNYTKALKWYRKVNFNFFTMNDFKNYIQSINNLNNFIKQKQLLLALEEYAIKNKRNMLLYVLGVFYLKATPFYDSKKAIKLLNKAYRAGCLEAGVKLGIFYIQGKNNKYKGYTILKKLIYKDSNAAYYIGNYLYNIMIENEMLMNSKCITINFNKPKEFYNKKLKILKYNNLFTRENIVKAYKLSYKLGNKQAFYKLIQLDIEDNTFNLFKKTYSGMSLHQIIDFLKKQNNMKADMILASIYEKYQVLNSISKVKKIYLKYINTNKTKIYWKLYQYEKNFENKINYNYLNYLVKNKFVPAIIEKSYQEAVLKENLNKNKDILIYYANQNNILALKALGYLYYNKIFLEQNNNKWVDYYVKACKLEKKPFYIPLEDLKIAAYNNKTFIVNYYYSYMNNKTAQKFMATYYKKNCRYKELNDILFILNKENSKEGTDMYYSSILLGYIKGNYKQALDYFKKRKDVYSYMLLGDIYAFGYHVNINPERAEIYYKKAFKLGYDYAIMKTIFMYENINMNGFYNKKIISLFKIAIEKNIQNAKYYLAKFYFSLGKNIEALKMIKKIKNYQLKPKTRYLMYLITGKIKYISGNESNYGYLLLAKSYNKNLSSVKALYYAFRAMMCNTPDAVIQTYTLMKKINDVSIINKIYEKAKKAPICYIE